MSNTDDHRWDLCQGDKGYVPECEDAFEKKLEEWETRNWMDWLGQQLIFPFLVTREEDEHDAYFSAGAAKSPFRLGHKMEVLALVEGAPPMRGLEYLNGAVLARLWDELDAHVHAGHRPSPGWGGGVSEKLQPGLERGWTRHLSSGGEQAQPGVSVCFPGHLYPSRFRAGKSSASAVGPRFGGVRGGEESCRAGRVVVAGAAGGGTEQAGPRIVGLARDFSSASLAARTGVFVSAKHPFFRAKRPGGADSGLVEGGPATPAAGNGADWRG